MSSHKHVHAKQEAEGLAHEEGNQGCGKRARQGDLESRSKKSSKMPLTSVTKYPCSVGKPSDPSLFLVEEQRVQ